MTLGVLLGLVLVGLAAAYVTRRVRLEQADGRHTERGQARHRHPSAARARWRDAEPRGRVSWHHTAPTNPEE